jgi:SPP1 gp7 family putative phage head morphogenesis protein
VTGGVLKVNEAQRILGLPVDDTQDFYLRPFNVIQISSGGKPISEPVKIFSAGNALLDTKNLKLNMPEEHKEAIWTKYANETEAHEAVFRQTLKGLFDDQAAEVIRNYKKHKNIDDALFNEAQANDKFDKAFKSVIANVFLHFYRDGAGLVSPNTPHKAEDNEVETKLALQETFELENPEAVEWISSRSLNLAQMVNGTTRKQLRAVLAEGVDLGESIPKITKRIKEFYTNGYERRAQIVARTEVIAAANEGAIQGFKEAGVEYMEFYAALDERICPDCSALHEQIFYVKDAKNIIPIHPQCRCTWLPVVE